MKCIVKLVRINETVLLSHLGHRVHKTKDGILFTKDNFDDQAVWFAVYKDADMCGVARIFFNFKDNHILETAHYIPNETLWENRPLRLRKNYETCLKYKEYT